MMWRDLLNLAIGIEFGWVLHRKWPYIRTLVRR